MLPFIQQSRANAHPHCLGSHLNMGRLDVLFQQNFAAEKATKLLEDHDPFHSKAIFHACIAGFFLFISGIISGNVANNSVFYHIPKRIAKNPFLNYFFYLCIITFF